MHYSREQPVLRDMVTPFQSRTVLIFSDQPIVASDCIGAVRERNHMNGEASAQHLSAHRISAGWRIDEAVECTVIRMCPGRVGGGALIFTGSVCLLPTCLNPPGQEPDSFWVLCDTQHSQVGDVQTEACRGLLTMRAVNSWFGFSTRRV